MRLVAPLFAMSLLACSSNSDPPVVHNDNVSIEGNVGGAKFTLRHGYAFFGDETPALTLSLTDSDADMCPNRYVGNETRIEISVDHGRHTDLVPGKYPYGALEPTPWAGPRVIRISACNRPPDVLGAAGELTITEVTPDRVKGTFTFEFRDGGTASGSFDVPACKKTGVGASECGG